MHDLAKISAEKTRGIIHTDGTGYVMRRDSAGPGTTSLHDRQRHKDCAEACGHGHTACVAGSGLYRQFAGQAGSCWPSLPEQPCSWLCTGSSELVLLSTRKRHNRTVTATSPMPSIRLSELICCPRRRIPP